MPIGMEKEYRLRWMDFDRYGRMLPSTVFDIFQDIATLQANSISIGSADLAQHGLFWAVIRMKYEIVREPEYHEVVIARTWPHSPSRLSFLRDYSMRTTSGELLIKASSEWVVMDVNTRSIASVKDLYTGPADFDETRAFTEKLRKVKNFTEDPAQAHIVTPSYTDIDLNGHVNNAMYPDFVIDALNPGPNGAIKTLQIDYKREVLSSSHVRVYTHKIDDATVLAKGLRDDGETAFACCIQLR